MYCGLGSSAAYNFFFLLCFLCCLLCHFSCRNISHCCLGLFVDSIHRFDFFQFCFIFLCHCVIFAACHGVQTS
eukprot:UN04103